MSSGLEPQRAREHHKQHGAGRPRDGRQPCGLAWLGVRARVGVGVGAGVRVGVRVKVGVGVKVRVRVSGLACGDGDTEH